MLVDDKFAPWTIPVIDHATYDDCYLMWLVPSELLTSRRWRLPICRTIKRETYLPDLLGIIFDG